MNKEKILNVIFLGFIFFFFLLLFAKNNGYYETRNTKNSELTKQQIMQFEEDIKNGKEIDIKNYSPAKEIDYSSSLSNGIYKISLKLENAIDQGIKLLFNKASKAIND